jgi:hypothetical protein
MYGNYRQRYQMIRPLIQTTQTVWRRPASVAENPKLNRFDSIVNILTYCISIAMRLDYLSK